MIDYLNQTCKYRMLALGELCRERLIELSSNDIQRL